MRLQTAPCGFLGFDDRRQITAVNDEARRHLGYEEGELLGQGVELILPPAVRILFHATVYPALADGRRADELYALLRCKSGEDLPVLLNASRRRYGDGFQTDCVFLAVKRRNSFERHLEQLEAAQRGAGAGQTPPPVPAHQGEFIERMSSLGVLLAGIMHEVRNPLTYVQGNIEIMAAEFERQPVAVDYQRLRQRLAAAADGIARVGQLVSAVGMVSRLEPGDGVPVDLSRVADAAVRLVQHSVTRQARIDIDHSGPGPVVLADSGRLAQVVINLVMNAGQALHAHQTAGGVIRIRTFVDNGNAVLTVADNGPGVPIALRRRIFDAFYTTKPVGEGTGLGLHISREIMTALGGSLELEPPSDAGATFRVAMPLLRSADRVPSPATGNE